MRKLLFACVLLALVVAAAYVALPATAQTDAHAASSGPPPVLVITREEVKPGKGAMHEKSEAAWAAAYRKANLGHYYLGTTAMSGLNDAWFFSAFTSLQDAEKETAALEANKAAQAELDRINATDGELLSGSRTTFAFYDPELSYRPDFNLGDYKYFMVDTVRMKMGRMEKFDELRKAVNAAHTKANMDEHMLVYHVGLGAPGGTVIVFQPLKSLVTYDEFPKTHGKGSAYYDAIGDEGRKMMTDMTANDVQYFQRDLLAISPAMSVVSEKTMAANPSFWKPKTAMAKAPAKTATPAAKKETKTEKK